MIYVYVATRDLGALGIGGAAIMVHQRISFKNIITTYDVQKEWSSIEK